MSTAIGTGRRRKRSAPGLRITGATKNLRMVTKYSMLSALQTPFVFLFWALAQRKGKLADRAGKPRPQTSLAVVDRVWTRGEAKRGQFRAEVR
jgi:hypothetical protein